MHRILSPAPIFVSVKQAAHMLGISPWACYQLCESGTIESSHHGRRRLVDVKSLQKYAAELSAEATR